MKLRTKLVSPDNKAIDEFTFYRKMIMALPRDIDLLNTIYNWHHRRGPAPIPRHNMLGEPDDASKGFEKAYSNEHIHVPMGYEHDLKRYLEDDRLPMLFIEANALALVSAAMNEFSTQEIAQIAVHHMVSASDFITSFNDLDEILGRGYKPGIRSTEVLRRCFSALERVSHDQILEFYEVQEEDENSLIMIMTAAKSPRLWPKTLISGYAKENEGRSGAPDRELSTILHSFIPKVVHESQLPHDSHGPRIDWFLDRSGMLLPAVTTKALGYFNLWEDLVHAASQKNCRPVIEQIMHYCLDNPPPALRPGIEHGLRGMTVASSLNITDGLGMHVYLQQNLKGTWLEPVLSSDVLKLNLLGSNDEVNAIAKLNGNFDEDDSLWEDQARLGERVFQEIAQTPIDHIGVAHFDAVGYLGRVVGPQDYSPSLAREKTLVHLLSGLKRVLGKEKLSTEEIDEVREFAIERCKTAVRLLGHNYEFDYEGFRGLSSIGVRVLAEAGLDLRKLPRMNNRDKGRVLENDLGM